MGKNSNNMGVADEAPQEPVEGGWDVSDDRKFLGAQVDSKALCPRK